MTEVRNTAAKLITEAADTIINKRPGVHGSAEDSFEMIADLWNVWLKHRFRTTGSWEMDGGDVAQMMTLLKKARAVYGDPMNEDNYVDDIGYTALAGMLNLPNPDAEIKPFTAGKKPADRDAPIKEATLKEAK